MKPKENKIHCTPQDCSFVPTLAVTLWLGWNGGLILLLIYLVFLATPLQRNVIIGILTLSFLLPASFPKKLGTRFGHWVAHNALKYFGMKVTIEDERSLEAVGGKGPIFALEPHDILPYYCVMFNGSLDILPTNLRETSQVLMTGAIFKIPIMKHGKDSRPFPKIEVLLYILTIFLLETCTSIFIHGWSSSRQENIQEKAQKW